MSIIKHYTSDLNSNITNLNRKALLYAEGLAKTLQPYKFGGKELDRMNGLDWSDFGARMLDSASPSWGTIDPMAEKYYSISPYTYCAANPILYVDPNGMDWFTATYNGESFYFYDKRVKNQDDIAKHYGADHQASYVGTSSSFSKKTDGKDNQYNLNADGSFAINGKTATSEYNRDGSIHIGNDTFTNMNTVTNNIYGSYLGGSNPQLNGSNGGDSYAVPPRNRLDYSAYLHDKGYDAKGANGIRGAFLNTNVIGADFNLAVNSYIASKTSFNIKRVLYASATSYLFLNIALLKVAKKGGENTVQYVKNLFK